MADQVEQQSKDWATMRPGDRPEEFYVASDGNDANSGKSPLNPWRTVTKVNSTVLDRDAVVYFKRGDIWLIIQLQAQEGVTFKAYGSGLDPIVPLAPGVILIT